MFRHTGVSVGPGAALDALRALALVGVERREDVRDALRALLAQKREQRELFDQAFDLFWSARLRGDATPALDNADAPIGANQQQPLAPRITDALAREGFAQRAPAERAEAGGEYVASFSPDEALRQKDFDQMSAAELASAEQALARFELQDAKMRTRRWCASPRGTRLDWRATLRQCLSTGGDAIDLARKARMPQQPPLVALCDISGSMDRYTRVFLHFLHAIAARGTRLHVFLFGTRLTNVSRQLAHRDIDLALADIARRTDDWSGGTRIGASLHEFNQRWSRRVLGQNASVLLFTDGLERGDNELLSTQMQRLKKSCRALLWLNPLLRYEAFEPKAGGIRAMLPHARMLPVHNLASVAQLIAALNHERYLAWK